MAGIYLHIPFCKQACTYCNFHFSTQLKSIDSFFDALVIELGRPHAYSAAGKKIETIYFGGGTPSLLSQLQLNTLLGIIYENYEVEGDAEITLEANPDDLTTSTLQDIKNCGINRLSVGLQTFNHTELLWMNRAHNRQQAISCLQTIRDTGFSNFSVDLIYGSPLQTDSILNENIERIVHAGVPHISCYALTVENGTALGFKVKKGLQQNVDDAKQLHQFEILRHKLLASGYEQYEISNFALPGFRSMHNSSYWHGKPYYGFGPAAHSFNGFDRRGWNVANNALYIQNIADQKLIFEEETLSETDRHNEYIMTGLRTAAGISLPGFESLFGVNLKERLLHHAAVKVTGGTLTVVNNHIQLTEKGLFLADGIAADLFKTKN